MAKELKISKTSVQGFKRSFKINCIQHRQLLSLASKAKRFDSSETLLGEMRRVAEKYFLWTYKNVFTVETVTKNQKDRVYAHRSLHLLAGWGLLFRRQKPASVMVWAGVVSYGSKLSSSSLMLVINSNVYVDILREKVLSCITETIGDGSLFIHNGSPTHTSNMTQTWSKLHFRGFWTKQRSSLPARISNRWTSPSGLS